MLRGKWAPVMKNIHSRKPHFPLNTGKKLTSPITEVFQCHSMSALSLHLLLWRQPRTCLWKCILGLPLCPIDCAPFMWEPRVGGGWRGQSSPQVLPHKRVWPFEGFQECFHLIFCKTSWDEEGERFKERKYLFRHQKGTEHNPWKEDLPGSSADKSCGMLWRRHSTSSSP